jgi:hypothetical protein
MQMIHHVSINQHKHWAATSTTEQTYNSAHITKWLKKIHMHFFKLLFHLAVKILQYCFEQYNITVT